MILDGGMFATNPPSLHPVFVAHTPLCLLLICLFVLSQNLHPPSLLQGHALAPLVIKPASCLIVTTRVFVFAATPLTLVITLIITPPPLLHACCSTLGAAFCAEPMLVSLKTSASFSSNHFSPLPPFW